MSLEYEAELIIPNCTWEWNNPVLRKRGELNKTRERENPFEVFRRGTRSYFTENPSARLNCKKMHLKLNYQLPGKQI